MAAAGFPRDGRISDGGEGERGPALGAAQLIALVDIELVDFDFGIAFGAGGHSGLRSLRIPQRRDDREYSENVRKSATRGNARNALFR